LAGPDNGREIQTAVVNRLHPKPVA
jgi:hypothetical protein